MTLIKTTEEIAKMRTAGKILSFVLDKVKMRVTAGITTKELDNYAENLIREQGGLPGFLNYKPAGATRPYPATMCASINEIIVHGVPSNRILRDGDLLKIDLGVTYDGYNADAAITIMMGNASPEIDKLIHTTEKALMLAIEKARPKNTLGDIGAIIQATAHKAGLSVAKGLTGHGIGKLLHEEPSVMNEGVRGEGLRLEPGMTIAIEPMFTLGTSHIVQQDDDSYAIADGSLSAHFEHTILITKGSAEILTQ